MAKASRRAPGPTPPAWALDFFGDLFFGKHHIPGEVKRWGEGWQVCYHSDFSTYDFDQLTRLVVLAHDRSIRASVEGAANKYLRICIWQRKGSVGEAHERHPTLEQAVDRCREIYPRPEETIRLSAPGCRSDRGIDGDGCEAYTEHDLNDMYWTDNGWARDPKVGWERREARWAAERAAQAEQDRLKVEKKAAEAIKLGLPPTWAEWRWPDWVPEKIRNDIQEHWSKCDGVPLDYVRHNAKNGHPPIGTLVEYATFRNKQGRWVPSWGNSGRVVHADGSYSIAQLENIRTIEEAAA